MCQVCSGTGRQGLTDLSPDCTNCRGVGYLKPGYGAGAPGMVVPPYGGIPPSGPGMYPPAGGYGPGAYGPHYGPGYIPPMGPHY